jgi:ABC-type sugar transport system permease subunit
VSGHGKHGSHGKHGKHGRNRRYGRTRNRGDMILVLPALATIALVALVPMAWTFWESLFRHDLRMPWLGRPFVGLGNYLDAFGDERFRGAALHTAFFVAASLVLQIGLGLLYALAMSRTLRSRGIVRIVVLAAWAVPTVVAALAWRFMFEGHPALVHSQGAWMPILLADTWKMTPFVALILLAGLESIDPALYDAARLDGARAWQQFREITLPLLKPALLVAVLFRALDAFRVFDVIFVMTGGGPGTATEPLSLYTFTTLLQHLRFGYGAALSMIIFLTAFAGALLFVRLWGHTLTGGRA